MKSEAMFLNKYERRSAVAYNKKAADYDNSREGKFTLEYNMLLSEIVKIKAGDAVLDVACGNGRLLKMFADQYSFDGYGVDISEKMIEQAKSLNPSIKFVVGPCEPLPFEDNTFDIITVSAAYHHFPNVSSFAKEAYRVLKKGGVIHIADLNLPAIVRAIYNPLLPLLRAGDVKLYSPDEIKETLKGAGFQKVSYIIIDGKVQIAYGYHP